MYVGQTRSIAVDSQQKSVAVVHRAGTKLGPSFDLKDESIDEGTFCLLIYLSYTTVFFMYSRNQRLVKYV